VLLQTKQSRRITSLISKKRQRGVERESSNVRETLVKRQSQGVGVGRNPSFKRGAESASVRDQYVKKDGDLIWERKRGSAARGVGGGDGGVSSAKKNKGTGTSSKKGEGKEEVLGLMVQTEERREPVVV